MKILTHKDLILGFLKQNLANKEHQKQIRQILDNENSVFILSKKFFTFIREELTEDYLHEYERIVTKLSDSGVSVKSSETSENFEDEILHIFSSLKDNVVVSISCDQPSQEIQNAIPNIAILSQQQKPNYHWLVVNLAILHPNSVQVRNYDFTEDSQVDIFFNDVFYIPRKIENVSIFDDACNLKHKKFDFLSKRRSDINVFYYTAKLENASSQQRFKSLQAIFNAKMFGKPKGGHEREINFEGIVIIPTNDFWMLNIKDDKKWTISILYNKEEAQKSLEYAKTYIRFLNNRWQ